jgi:hypothetical protein
MMSEIWAPFVVPQMLKENLGTWQVGLYGRMSHGSINKWAWVSKDRGYGRGVMGHKGGVSCVAQQAGGHLPEPREMQNKFPYVPHSWLSKGKVMRRLIHRRLIPTGATSMGTPDSDTAGQSGQVTYVSWKR